jgi:hypothetical protein
MMLLGDLGLYEAFRPTYKLCKNLKMLFLLWNGRVLLSCENRERYEVYLV